MSLHFIIDGYNVIKKGSFFERDSISDSRALLIHFIKVYRPQGSLNNKISVFFDGRPGISSLQKDSSIDIIISYDSSADDNIKDFVKKSSNPKNIVVVSDDRDIKLYSRSLGAKIRPVDEFVNKLKKRAKGPTDTPTLKQDVSAKEALQITNELKHIWLK